MKRGRISRTVWGKYIRNQLDEESVTGSRAPLWTENCSGLRGKGSEVFFWAEAAVSGVSGETGYYGVLHAAGELAARGIRPSSASARLLLPTETPEEKAGELAAGIREACRQMDLQISRISGESSDACARPVVMVTAAGAGDGTPMPPGGIQPGQEILLCGYAGLEGTLRLLWEAREELAGRFVSVFLDRAAERKKELVTPDRLLPLIQDGGDGNITAVRQIGSGGVFAALWEMAEESETGMELDLRRIPLRQETVEICEFFRLNPYQLTSAGSYLLAADNGTAAVEALTKAGIKTACIGFASAGKGRILKNGGEQRYLDRPAPDELLRWQDERQG